MSPPRVLSCTDPPVRERAPPEEGRTAEHPWCTARSLEVCRRLPPTAYIYKTADEKIRNHAQLGLLGSHEVMGLMVGGLFRWDDQEYTLVRDVVTTDLDSDMLGVRFRSDGFKGLIDSLDDLDFNYRIVGWYHSHPGIGCFLSHIDHSTQSGIFNQTHHSALVVDPKQKEIEVYSGRDLTSFRVYWDRFQDPF